MSTEKKLTAVEQIFLMIENNEVSNLAEMKEWFINLEKQNIIDAWNHAETRKPEEMKHINT